jgi:predicted TIM-barrel fold metal-dependent hydrolase
MSMTTSDVETARLSTSKPLVVVSADTHIGPRVAQDLRSYCPEAYLPQFDEFVDGVRRKHEASKGQMGFGGMERSGEWVVSRRNLQTEGHYDIHARLRDLNNDGVAGEVIFHDSQNGEPLPFDTQSIMARSDEGLDFETMGVGRHIYNTWLADVVSVEPERHVGLAQLPIWDIDASVKEVEWAASAGLRGVNLPYTRSYMKSYNWPDWEPFWSACEDLGMALCHHGGGAPSVAGGPAAMSILKLELANMSRISPLSHLVFGGVFERHPKLNLILTESVGPWWPTVMREMDSVYLHDSWEYPDFKERVRRLPSEYAAEQVFVGSSFLARFEVDDAIANEYVGNIIWGSDYPHFEGTFQYGITSPEGEPITRAAQRFTFAGEPADVVTAMIGGNATRAYGLDRDALQKVADRINAPTHDDLSVAPKELPAETERGHHSFRTFGFWY